MTTLRWERAVRCLGTAIVVTTLAAGVAGAAPPKCNNHNPDPDGDGICNSADNCDTTPNPGQLDFDQDLVGDACDTCTDFDADGAGDPGFPLNTCPLDNCPAASNPGQADGDGDGPGDVCDDCPAVWDPGQEDADLDGEGDACDQWTVCAPVSAQPAPVILPDPDYVSFVPPPKGASYVDAALGCSVTRLSDGPTDFTTPVRHDPVFVSPFNSTSTLIAVKKTSPPPGGGLPAGDMVIDHFGNVIRDTAEMAGITAPRWSVTDPYLIYFVEGSRLRSYDVNTQVRLDVHDFSVPQPPEQTASYPAIEIGPATNSDISEDGDHFVVSYQGNVHLYTISSDHVGPRLSGGAFADPGASVGFCDVTADSDKVLCLFGFPAGNRRFELFDGATGAPAYGGQNFVIDWSGHGDVGRDENGDEILVLDNSGGNGPFPPDCYPGVEKVSLEQATLGQRSCLISWAHADPTGGGWFGKTVHVSLNNVGGHPWALVSTDDADAIGTRDFDLPANWQDLWGVYFNELILVRLDGSQIHRLAHHRSRDGADFVPVCDPSINAGYGYWATVRASLSRDGRRLVFDSNYGLRISEPTPACTQPPVKNYGDIYLMDVSVGPNPPVPPDCDRCQITYCTGVEIGCRATGQCGPGGCCVYECGVSLPNCVFPECPRNVCGGC